MAQLALPQNARLVLNNGAYINIADSAFLVIDNSNTNAITSLNATSYIVSENEDNGVKWNIAGGTGTYTIPFGANVGGWQSIPLSINIGTGGAGGGYLRVATWGGATWDNETYEPSDVTNMCADPCPDNNSDRVIDRFWVIDPLGYTTRPALNSITFTYIDAEHSAAGNSITEARLAAQQFDVPLDEWLSPTGISTPASDIVTTGAIVPGNFRRSWTLSDRDMPLPVELIEFTSECVDEAVLLQWKTISETNNSYFLLEYMDDTTQGFMPLTTINGSGSTNQLMQYSFLHTFSTGLHQYYRLTQVDYDGTENQIKSTGVNCSGSFTQELKLISVDLKPEGLSFTLSSSKAQNIRYSLRDLSSRHLTSNYTEVNKGVTVITGSELKLSSAVYLLEIISDNDRIVQKLLLQK